MTEVREMPKTLQPPPVQIRPDAPPQQLCNPLLITFLLRSDGPEVQVCCRGCREITPPAQHMPDHISGSIEIDRRCVPVIDAGVWLGAEETDLGHCSCILVVEHECDSRRLSTGVIVRDIEEVMQLAAGTFAASVDHRVSVNMHFVLQACREKPPHPLLAEVHRDSGLLDGEHAPFSGGGVLEEV